ncbi:MAG: lipid IV(A) 3-deoxy-D-manno-octulosonic acid transferase [Gammaproteobacteria bacterium]|nr:lipid IV(A) 3-deoxy-D-manno-octulosonic acid transferase [Gammaproteobacteria bacterium]
MNLAVYNGILRLVTPMIFLRLLWRSRKNPVYRQNWRQRLGYCPLQLQPGCLWIHAVSVGEAQAAEPLVRQLLEHYPKREVLITTTTPTGADHVLKLYGERVHHCYFPIDLDSAIGRFLDRVQPSLLLMMETEIWPNLLRQCIDRGIPSLLANARLSAKSAQRYRKLSGLTREVFGWIDRIAAQSEADAARFVELGVPAQRVRVIGSLKFDLSLPASLFEQAEALRRRLGPQRPLWVAASTREGEEGLVLQAHRRLLASLPEALLILVPRHPERFDGVEALCRQQAFRVQRRSQAVQCQADTQVYLADSMGELPLLLATADAAFVGGSLVPLGGHNVLEAAVLGRPVVFGPHMFNFAAISELLLEEGAARQVADPAALAQVMGDWLKDANARQQVGERGRQVVEKNRGAGLRLLQLVQELLSETGAKAP